MSPKNQAPPETSLLGPELLRSFSITIHPGFALVVVVLSSSETLILYTLLGYKVPAQRVSREQYFVCGMCSIEERVYVYIERRESKFV